MRFHLNGGSAGTIAGKIGTTIFGLIFGSIGLFIAIMATRDNQEARKTQTWHSSPCRIEAVDTTSTGDGYRLALTYRYNYDGKEYTSDRYTRKGNHTFDDIATSQRLLKQFAPGSSHTCYVNPSNPAQAVLKQTGSVGAMIGIVAFCSIFILIGYGLAISAWRPVRYHANPQRATSKTSNAARGRIAGICFGAVFVAVGLGVTYATFVKPLQLQRAARSWIATPATVLNSSVRSHRGDDSTTYSVYIAYEYTHNGEPWQGDRFSFSSGSSSGRAKKQAIVNRFPKSHRFEVYVDPQDPSSSVIQRDAGASLYLGLIPIVFALAGGGIIIAILRSTGQGKRRRKRRHNPRSSDLETEFKPASGHVGRILGTLFAALFWNGIVSVFVIQIAGEWARGKKPIGGTLFISIFVLIGLGIIAGVIYQILRVFNPSLKIDAPPSIITPGAAIPLPFHIKGPADRLTSMSLTLKGEERATYRRGTDTRTDTRTFYDRCLYRAGEGMILDQGTAQLQIPQNAMHSFNSSNNEIRWTLEVKGSIPRWPDLSESYTLNVIPREARS